jgi:hypothetical protein
MKVILKITFLPVLLLALAMAAFADGVALYNTIPSPLPPNLVSLGYEANSISAFGDLIQFQGDSSTYALTSATVVLSDQSYLANWSSAVNGTTITDSGFYLPLTLNIYSVGSGNSAGALIATQTIENAFIPWRPDPTAGCGNGYLASDGLCHSGSLASVTFNLGGLEVPDRIIYSLAFNTTDNGAGQTNVPGPYDSLNFALATTPPTAGSNPLPDTGYYTDSGTGVFHQDTGWTPYSGAVEFSGQAWSAEAGASDQLQSASAPEPSSLLLLATGVCGLTLLLMRRGRVRLQLRKL